MFPKQSPRPRRDGRRRRLAVPVHGPESLEGRQLLSYSPIGSLPDLVATGEAGPIAAYGGPISVKIDLRNLGASSQTEPLDLEPGAQSTADALASHVGVYLLRTAHTRIGGPGSIRIGDVPAPYLRQNSVETLTETLTLPGRPKGFAGSGGTVYIGFRADDLRETRDLDRTNNNSKPVAVQINAALPDLTAINIDLPPTLQPGDTIAPVIKVANYGTVDTATQGPVTVLLVASTDQFYGPTDTIVGQYVIQDLPGLSQAPSSRTVLGDANLDNPPNVIDLSTTSSGQGAVTLPSSSTGYYLGVIVDPLNTIREIKEIGSGPSSQLQFVRRVAPVAGLPTAGILSDPSPVANVFPIPAFAPLTSLSDFLGDASQATQLINSTGGGGFNVLKVARPSKPAKTPASGSTTTS